MAKIIIVTPILYDRSSPFNHLFQDIIGGFLDAGNQVIRFVACRDKEERDFMYGFDGKQIEYKRFIRKSSEKSKFVIRYLRDTLTNIRMARCIREVKDADVLFEDVSYSSFWSVHAAKKNGIRVVAMVQDVWPDNAVQSGLISEGSLIYWFFEYWQKQVYRKSDRIICISDDMKSFIESKGVPTSKIDVIYNWGYSDEPINISWEENQFVKKHNLDRDTFYAVYAGNIGRMQNVELIIKAAEILKDNKKIVFLIIGDGVKRKEIGNLVDDLGLQNVQMLPMQPMELATAIYSAAGVNIIPLVPGGVNTALPSKIGIVLACGRPIIFALGKESIFTKNALRYHGIFSVSPMDAAELSRTITEVDEKVQHVSDCTCTSFFLEKFCRSSNSKLYCETIGRQ